MSWSDNNKSLSDKLCNQFPAAIKSDLSAKVKHSHFMPLMIFLNSLTFNSVTKPGNLLLCLSQTAFLPHQIRPMKVLLKIDKNVRGISSLLLPAPYKE